MTALDRGDRLSEFVDRVINMLDDNRPMPRTSSVRPGRDRPPTDLVWPQSLTPPPDHVRLVYLDLNHWIGLAKANTGHSDGAGYVAALGALRVADPTFVFPLSSVHYMEITAIRDPRQRSDIATVIEEFSRFACLMSNSILIQLEVDAVVARRVGRPERIAPIPLLGHGVMQAFGMRGGLQIRSPEGDRTDEARRSWPGGQEAFDAFRADAELRLNRMALAGPSDAEVPGLQADGWDPTAARRVAIDRAKQETEQAARLAAEPRWRRGRLRDLVAARYTMIEAMDALNDALSFYGLTIDEFAGGSIDDAREFTDSMPSADVYISLMTAAHSNAQTTWEPNDIFDIDAMSAAVAYSDVVVMERHRAHLLNSGGVAKRHGTTVLSDIADLVPIVTAAQPHQARS